MPLNSVKKSEIVSAVIIVVLLIAIIAVQVRSCSNSEASSDVSGQSGESEQVVYNLDDSINSASITDEVKAKFLKLAQNEPAAAEYLNGLSAYPQAGATGNTSIPSEESDHPAPLFYQWDTRWGYIEYSSAPFGSSGCGPTSMAMIYQGLTKNTDQSPYTIAMLAREVGYETENAGTDGRLYTDYAGQLGMNCEYLYPDKQLVIDELSTGSMLMFNVGEGDFTSGGHYIVACGLTSDEELIINDPYSSINSNKAWEIDRVLEQTESIYRFWV